MEANNNIENKELPSKYFLLTDGKLTEYIEVIDTLNKNESSILILNCNLMRYEFDITTGLVRIEFCKNIKRLYDKKLLINITFYDYQERLKEIINELIKQI